MTTPGQAQNAVISIMNRVDHATHYMEYHPDEERGSHMRLIRDTANELRNHGIPQTDIDAYVTASTEASQAMRAAHMESGGAIVNVYNRVVGNDTSRADQLTTLADAAKQRRDNLSGRIIQTARNTAHLRAGITPGEEMNPIVVAAEQYHATVAHEPLGTGATSVPPVIPQGKNKSQIV